MKTARKILILILTGLFIILPVFPIKSYAADYSQILLTEEEKTLVAALCYHETKDEPLLSKVSFCAMILNRLQSKFFPNSIRKVVFDGGAFESAMNGKLSVLPSKEEMETDLLALEYTLTKDLDPTCGSFFTMMTDDPHLWEIKVLFTVNGRSFGIIE